MPWWEAARYVDTRDFIDENWAWELLRRDPDYRAAWRTHVSGGGHAPSAITDNVSLTYSAAASSELKHWGLLTFEDPTLTAPEARVFWSPDACSTVLPVHAFAGAEGGSIALDLSTLRCDILAVAGAAGEQHVLFSDGYRRLQLTISGADIRNRPHFLTDAIVGRRILGRRLDLIRRLSDLAARGSLAPQLYPPMPGARRLRLVLRALDGALDGASHRDIAIAVFGIERVKADWADPSESLRNFIRAAIRRGKALMKGGYRNFLR
jgi:hypothetical protein